MAREGRRDGEQGSAYAAAASGAAREANAPVGLLGSFLPELAGAAAGNPLGTGELDGYRAHGRAAAEDGVVLRDLVDLYLSGGRRVWPLIPAVKDARDADKVRQVAADVLTALCEGYQQARRAAARAEDALRREFVDDLLTGTSDLGQLVERAPAFGLRLESSHVVLVVRGSRRFLDHRARINDVEAALAARASRSPAEPSVLVATKHGLLVCVIPAVGSLGGPEATGPAAAALVGGALAREAGLTWRMAVSRPRTGAAGVRAGFEEAQRAVELAERIGVAAPVVQARDLLVYEVLTRDRQPIIDLIQTVLGPLTAARGGAGPLVDTLEGYCATGGNAVATGRRLHLSVRAVTYRLDRVRRLTGRDPGDPQDRFVLEAAVRGARVLGWPAAELPGPV